MGVKLYIYVQYMHGYYSTCINILVIFSLALSLLLSPHSPSRLTLRDQHHTTAARRTRLINITPLPSINIKHTLFDQIAIDHSFLTLRFSHLIKIKPLPLIKIKPLLLINIKPLPHEA